MAVLISFGRRGKRHHADRALILEWTNFRTVSDLRSGTDGVIRVEEIASPGGANAATNAVIIIVIVIIVFSLVSIGV